MKRVLIIGGYGNFGRFISRSLAKDSNLQLIIAGRSIKKAQALADDVQAQACCIDIHENFQAHLQELAPDIVIHTSGPFQSQSYDVAMACIACGVHYIDLADAREFVMGIGQLDQAARNADVLVVSGASSVPCLTSALIDHYQHDFSTLDAVEYGITTAQKTTRGLATTAAILSYTGKPFTTLIDGKPQTLFGWQSIHSRMMDGLGRRYFANCDIPDLALFPDRYPSLKTIRFYAGLELPLIHFTLWCLSWLVRAGLIKSLEPTAPALLKLSFLFDFLGSADSGFYLELTGKQASGEPQTRLFELVARNGDGPYIPCIPAILLTRKLANGCLTSSGAMPCVGLISKQEYLDALKGLDISWHEFLI